MKVFWFCFCLILFNPRAFIPRILRITTHKLCLYIQIVSFVITILWCRWTGIDFPIFQRKFRELKKRVQCDTALTGERGFKSRLFWLPSQESLHCIQCLSQGKNNGFKDNAIHWSTPFIPLVKHLLYHMQNIYWVCFWNIFFSPI